MHHRSPLLFAAFLLAIGGPAAPLAAPSPGPGYEPAMDILVKGSRLPTYARPRHRVRRGPEGTRVRDPPAQPVPGPGRGRAVGGRTEHHRRAAHHGGRGAQVGHRAVRHDYHQRVADQHDPRAPFRIHDGGAILRGVAREDERPRRHQRRVLPRARARAAGAGGAGPGAAFRGPGAGRPVGGQGGPAGEAGAGPRPTSTRPPASGGAPTMPCARSTWISSRRPRRQSACDTNSASSWSDWASCPAGPARSIAASAPAASMPSVPSRSASRRRGQTRV